MHGTLCCRADRSRRTLGFWEPTRDLNPAVTITCVIVAYAVLNLWDARVSADAIADLGDRLLNCPPVQFFANAEFGFAMGKVLLSECRCDAAQAPLRLGLALWRISALISFHHPAVTGLLLMTFITMLGGNPAHDRFGFRFWSVHRTSIGRAEPSRKDDS